MAVKKYSPPAIAALAVMLGLAACSSSDPRYWSRSEKGAAAGGVVGAGLGAIVGHETGSTLGGAVIGGAAGAGTGAIIGDEMDEDARRRERRAERHY